MIMPAHWFNYMTDADLGALIAYLKTVEPVDNELPRAQTGVLAAHSRGIGAVSA